MYMFSGTFPYTSSLLQWLSDHLKEFTHEQYRLIQQSHDVFVYDKEQRLPFTKKQAAAMNGDIITDSDSDDGELYVGLTTCVSA